MIRRTVAVLAALLLVAGASVTTAAPASAHWIAAACRGSHFQPPYQNDVASRRVYSGVGTYGPWVETSWRVTNRITGSVHYDYTERRCLRYGY